MSEEYRYRYTLRRQLGGTSERTATFVLCNPSTAESAEDGKNDPTVRTCMAFGQTWGCSELVIVNLFAYRATDPLALLTAPDPVGPLNDAWILLAASHARLTGGPLVFGWGTAAKLRRSAPMLLHQAQHVRRLLKDFDAQALGFTNDLQPSHPLYIPRARALVPVPAFDTLDAPRKAG